MTHKREWIEGRRHPSVYENNTSALSPEYGHRLEGGEMIEREMKRLRVAYNYDGVHGVRWAGEVIATDMDMETSRAKAVRSEYAEANSLLREFHYLRQLRKFQTERRRVRASDLVDEDSTTQVCEESSDMGEDGMSFLARGCT